MDINIIVALSVVGFLFAIRALIVIIMAFKVCTTPLPLDLFTHGIASLTCYFYLPGYQRSQGRHIHHGPEAEAHAKLASNAQEKHSAEEKQETLQSDKNNEIVHVERTAGLKSVG